MRFYINSSIAREYLIDEVGIKSGILLTVNDLYNLIHDKGLNLDEDYIKDNILFSSRPEDFAMDVLNVRESIGNIKNANQKEISWTHYLIELSKSISDPNDLIEKFQSYLASNNVKIIDDIVIKNFSEYSGYSLKDVVMYVLSYNEYLDSKPTITLYGNNNRQILEKEWDKKYLLSDLFDCPILPKSSDYYFDQRFIDYLGKNTQDINKIHWRNFESIISEYFHRNNYKVSLGPGTKDGGVDIRIWKDEESKAGPPLIIVQCKRYKEDNLVSGIEIKALYADTEYENAKYGLIATTSRISPDGHNIIKARNYNLLSAESKDVEGFIRGLWRNNPEY